MIDLWEEDDSARVGATLLDKFKVERLIGSGGMGAVYEAVNLWTGRRVAIKVLRGAFARNQSVLARFVQEARTATALQHPNVVDVLDICRTADGLIFIVQELLVGEDLRIRADRLGLPMAPSAALDIMVPIMGALVAVHRAGVIHRDIKPDNIFLVRDGRGPDVPKLIDFGVSKTSDTSNGRQETQSGVPIGTPDYMAPEQARGEAVDARVDVWAVGVVLFELLSGTLPFRGATTNLVLAAVMTGKPPSLATVAPGLPSSLVRVIDRALSVDPAARWPSMTAFLSALLDCEHTGYDRSAAEARHPASLAPLATNTASFRLPAPKSAAFAIDHGEAPSFDDAPNASDDFFDEAPTQYRSLDALVDKPAPSQFVVQQGPPPTAAPNPTAPTAQGTATPMMWGGAAPAQIDPSSTRLRTISIFLGLLVMALGGGLTGVILSLNQPRSRVVRTPEAIAPAPHTAAANAQRTAGSGAALEHRDAAAIANHSEQTTSLAVSRAQPDASVLPTKAPARSTVSRPQTARGLQPRSRYE